jgi:hypothetical protein
VVLTKLRISSFLSEHILPGGVMAGAGGISHFNLLGVQAQAIMKKVKNLGSMDF